MNRGDMRDLLRSRLQEEAADQWSDSRLNTILNIGLRRLQGTIQAVDPDAFVEMYRCDVVDASSDPERLRIYPWPDAFQRLVVLKYKGPTDSAYAPLKQIAYSATHNRTDGQLRWAYFGAGFVLSPYPTQAISNGLQLEAVETLSMSADSDVPLVAVALHEAITYFAHIECLQDTGEPTQPIWQDLQPFLALIPEIYSKAPGSAGAVNIEGI